MLNRRSKKLKLCPAAASQPTRLEVRLSDVQYGAAEHEAADLDDYQKRIALNNQLVQAFGSSRRCGGPLHNVVTMGAAQPPVPMMHRHMLQRTPRTLWAHLSPRTQRGVRSGGRARERHCGICFSSRWTSSHSPVN